MSWRLNARYVVRAHTYLALSAFLSALLLGSLLHYKKIVKNGVAGYPQEWWPSVSATIGDWYPERNIFQILIAITSGPRLALVLTQYYVQSSFRSTLAAVVLASGILRTLACGGWVYITSSDDHDVHDVFMISYMVLNLPWMIGTVLCTSEDATTVRRKRIYVSSGFFLAIFPLIYFFIQHKVHRIPGAYTRYAFFEWSLILFDILFDSVSEEEFVNAQVEIVLGSKLEKPITKSIPDEPISAATSNVPSSNVQASVPSPSSRRKGRSTIKAAIKPPASQLHEFAAQLQPNIQTLSDIYLSYIFWSVFTALIPTLFYFSIWKLGFEGHELAFASVLSPVLLGIPLFGSWARSHGGITSLHALTASGLASYVLNRPAHRLIFVTIANFAGMLRQVAEWSDTTDSYPATVSCLGLLLSSLAKHANHSNNPVWPLVNEQSGGFNKIGLLLSFTAVVERCYRSPPIATTTVSTGNTQPWSSAFALGGLLFSIHTFVSDASIIVAWSWTGYEDGRPRGPLPYLHGSVSLVIQALGAFLAVIVQSNPNIRLSHPIWFLAGAGSAFAMYKYRNWSGYAGGLGLTFFLMSIAPHVIRRATGLSARHYLTAMVVYCLLVLAHLWTVAYAFVPGGVYLRERTDIVLMLQLASLSLVFDWPAVFKADARTVISHSLSSLARAWANGLLAAICTTSVLVTLYRLPLTSPQPYRPGARVFRTGIWTLHFGFDADGRDSQRRVMQVIQDMELDVVGLLETDLSRVVYGNRDLTRYIVEKMGYHVDLGPGPGEHTWGAVLLSKFPIINSTHHLLPSPHGELAPAIEAVLNVFGTRVTVIVAHNGQEEDPLDRELQSTELARIMSASPYPTVFLGYVVTKPGDQRPSPYEILTVDGRMHDIDADDADRWCEYIFYRGVYRTSYARISRSTVTDTELQIGQFQLPRDGMVVQNDTQAARYLRSYKESLPSVHWFPMSYYDFGNDKGGVNGHFYHVFGTPLYYQLPVDAVV